MYLNAMVLAFLLVELEDPVENIGAKLVRQAAAKTNDLVGDGTTIYFVLAHVRILKNSRTMNGE